jgi:hypothetical protein
MNKSLSIINIVTNSLLIIIISYSFFILFRAVTSDITPRSDITVIVTNEANVLRLEIKKLIIFHFLLKQKKVDLPL